MGMIMDNLWEWAVLAFLIFLLTYVYLAGCSSNAAMQDWIILSNNVLLSS